MYTGNIDWSKFYSYDKDEITCMCGAIFHSHSKFMREVRRAITEDTCPKCGQNDKAIRVSSPPEKFTIGESDV